MNYYKRYYKQYRRRGYGRRNADPRLLAAGVGVAAALATGAGVAGHHHHHKHPAAAAASGIWAAAAGPFTPRTWAPAFLSAAGLPRTRCNRAAVVAWEQAEGGNWANSARFNPLDTTMPEPGSSPMNSVGVQAYTSWRQGLQASAATLRNGNYGGIIAAFRAGGSAQAVAGAVAASPWGTGSFQAGC